MLPISADVAFIAIYCFWFLFVEMRSKPELTHSTEIEILSDDIEERAFG